MVWKVLYFLRRCNFIKLYDFLLEYILLNYDRAEEKKTKELIYSYKTIILGSSSKLSPRRPDRNINYKPTSSTFR